VGAQLNRDCIHCRVEAGELRELRLDAGQRLAPIINVGFLLPHLLLHPVRLLRPFPRHRVPAAWVAKLGQLDCQRLDLSWRGAQPRLNGAQIGQLGLRLGDLTGHMLHLVRPRQRAQSFLSLRHLPLARCKLL